MSDEREVPGPIMVKGFLGWANPGTGTTAYSLATYGPEGRWATDRPKTKQAGDMLADALVEAGLTEGATLIVVAVPRFGDVEGVQRAVADAIWTRAKEAVSE